MSKILLLSVITNNSEKKFSKPWMIIMIITNDNDVTRNSSIFNPLPFPSVTSLSNDPHGVILDYSCLTST